MSAFVGADSADYAFCLEFGQVLFYRFRGNPYYLGKSNGTQGFVLRQ